MARTTALLATALLCYLAARQRALTEREIVRLAMLAGRAQRDAELARAGPSR
jgi:hypothetical protein